MRTLACVTVLCAGLALAVNAHAGAKDKKKDNTASTDIPAAAPAADATTTGTGKAKDKDKEKSGKKAETATARDAAEEKEAGGDETELNTLTQELGLSDAQRKEIEKEFEKYRARLSEIRSLPDKSPNEKLLKGPKRRALRADLVKWIAAHVSPGQSQKLDAYEKKRAKDLYDEQVNNRVARLTEAVHLNENQREKVRSIYDTELRGVHNAADALYAASQKSGSSVADLEKQLESKRESMKKAIDGVLKPDQLELYKKMDD